MSELVHKQLEAGQDIGYGATYTTEESQWIGTIPIGYADGWIREMQNFHVLIKGTIVPLLVAFSMDPDYCSPSRRIASGDQGYPDWTRERERNHGNRGCGLPWDH